MNLPKDVVLPVLTGIVAIVLERWIFNHSPAVRRFVGAENPD